MGDKKNKGGRPNEYKDSYCEKVVEVMREGGSKVEFCAEVGISYTSFMKYQKENPEFMESVKLAEMFCQAWWERKGRKATFGEIEGFNATSFIFNMKNRFPDFWKDKQEVKQESTITHNIMPVPTADSVDDWEKAAQKNQDDLLGES